MFQMCTQQAISSSRRLVYQEFLQEILQKKGKRILLTIFTWFIDQQDGGTPLKLQPNTLRGLTPLKTQAIGNQGKYS